MYTAVQRNPETDEEIKERVEHYWSGRSHSFAELREQELENEIAQNWLKEILPNLPEGKSCSILDVGTGGGFFAVLLTRQGHQVTGIDLTPSMIKEARILAMKLGIQARFEVMDAEQLDFEDASFDVVITRNLTWTLPHPDAAYAEWLRVLKPNGILLNFDADYGHDSCVKGKEELPPTHAHCTLPESTMEECEAIKQELTISQKQRPEWDIDTLKQIGYTGVTVDEDVYQRIYQKKDQFYNPTPIFMIRAEKRC